MDSPRTPNGPIRVVLVDDSAICRHQLREILQQDGHIAVVGEGSRGEDALPLIGKHKPQLLVIDLVMPGQGGQETISAVMASHPLPILVLTAQPEGVRQVAVFDAIRRGALDLAEKPRRGDRAAEGQLRRSVHTLASIPVVRHVAGKISSDSRRASRQRTSTHPLPLRQAGLGPSADDAETGSPAPEGTNRLSSTPPAPGALRGGPLVVGLGASAGGPAPLASLLASLTDDFPAAMAVVQHLPKGFVQAFAEYLRSRVHFPVKTILGREVIHPGVIYLAVDDHHLVTSGDYLCTSEAPAENGHRPSVELLFSSLANTHGSRASGVILSGIGNDGVRGMAAMRDKGALTLAQSEESCAVFGMPAAALQSGAARASGAPEELARELCRWAVAQPKWRIAQ